MFDIIMLFVVAIIGICGLMLFVYWLTSFIEKSFKDTEERFNMLDEKINFMMSCLPYGDDSDVSIGDVYNDLIRDNSYYTDKIDVFDGIRGDVENEEK